VVYRGSTAVAHAIESLNEAAREAKLGYLTNNASRTDAAVAEQLNGYGLRVDPEDIVTSPQAAVRLLAQRVPPGSLVLVVGGDGLVDELTKAGYRITRRAADRPEAVVQGFASHV